jgi:hypothetical protein
MVIVDDPARLAANAAVLERELTWLEAVIGARVRAHAGEGPALDALVEIAPPMLDAAQGPYAHFVLHHGLGIAERLVLALALAPHLRPRLLDPFFRVNGELQRGYTEFGGLQGRTHGGFLPTGETALFLLAGDDLQRRFQYRRLFDRGHPFARNAILRLEPASPGEPASSGALVIQEELVEFLATGHARAPDYSADFPARHMASPMAWEELVLSSSTREQLRELEAWSRHEAELMERWGLARRLRRGYRALFYGPPGTGKSITATLLGKRVGRPVYRIALSAVVSKYIGETEKNLERIFSRAEGLDCILFFDEADALFGRRTSVSDAHDRYANQEVAYLLQRIEDYRGVIILASNFEANIDEAFLRRFQAVVHFPMPNAAERRRLWAEALARPGAFDGVDLEAVAEGYVLSGGAIMNVVQYAALMGIEAGAECIRQEDLLAGIRRELQKEGKTL